MSTDTFGIIIYNRIYKIQVENVKTLPRRFCDQCNAIINLDKDIVHKIRYDGRDVHPMEMMSVMRVCGFRSTVEGIQEDLDETFYT